jgi:hypothetical protein
MVKPMKVQDPYNGKPSDPVEHKHRRYIVMDHQSRFLIETYLIERAVS